MVAFHMALPFCSDNSIGSERKLEVDSIVDDSDATLATPEDTSAETSSTDESFVDDITTTGDENDNRFLQPEAFHRWRPQHHLMASHGWMNDPCAPAYNARTGLYHVNFQWNPKGNSWGNLSWGSAQSPDLVHWKVSPSPSITPTEALDVCGVFTGCMLPNRTAQAVTAGDGKLTAFYTSAQNLPISYQIPYTRGSEQLAMATSSDNGRTWERIHENIILTEPPPGFDITSWRDPFVDTWDGLDTLVDDSERWLYGTLSGGLRGKTPTVFLYRVNPKDTTEWTFLGPLVELTLNFSPSRWSGDFGVNWEVSNFLTLREEDGTQHEVLITSAEGTIDDAAGGELSKDHRQMWMCGTLRKTETGQPELGYRYGGTLDHGSFYAANGFWDQRTNQFVAMGWIFEEDLPQPLVERQGWSGCLSLPRIVTLKTWKGVVGALRSDLSDLSCFEAMLEEDGTHTLRTVSAIPDPRLKTLRGPSISSSPWDDSIRFFGRPCSQWELEVAFDIGDSPLRVGFDIVHSAENAQYTRVYFEPGSETLVVDRSRSTTIKGINTKTRSAPHTLFEIRQGTMTRRESLTLHVYFDASVLEVFANDRTALTTRVYPNLASESGTCQGVRLFVETAKECASPEQPEVLHEPCISNCDLWELQSAISYPSM
jgi:beta-fructofuranosidase